MAGLCRPSDKLPSIYGLFDCGGSLRYVGKANDCEARLKGHMSDSRKKNTPLYAWIRKHGRPELRVLEASCVDWKEAERRHIREATARGDNLLNLAEGGEQPFCSKEVRAANGRKNSAAIQADPVRKRLQSLKLQLSRSLKQGYGSNALRAKLRQAATDYPATLGCFAAIQDREEQV